MDFALGVICGLLVLIAAELCMIIDYLHHMYHQRSNMNKGWDTLRLLDSTFEKYTKDQAPEVTALLTTLHDELESAIIDDHLNTISKRSATALHCKKVLMQACKELGVVDRYVERVKRKVYPVYNKIIETGHYAGEE